MTRFRRWIFAGMAAIAYASLAGCSNSDSTNTSKTSGPGAAGSFVYLASGSAEPISAFANDGNGGLTPVVGSPFTSPVDASKLAATSDGRFLYVQSYNSSVVTGYSINATSGVLTPLPCPAAPTGLHPISITIAPSGAFLYTANVSDVTALSIDANTGCLTLLQTVASDRNPFGLAVDRTGHFLYVTVNPIPLGAVLYSSVEAYSISSSGTPTRQPASDFNEACSLFPCDQPLSEIVANPTADLLFVLEGGGSDAVAVLTIDPSTGALTEAGGGAAGGQGPNGIAVDPTGTFVFVASTVGSLWQPGGLTTFSVAPGGVLTMATGSPFAGFSPTCLAIDPSGKFLYAGYSVSIQGTKTVGVTTYSFSSGVLTQKEMITTLPPSSIIAVKHP